VTRQHPDQMVLVDAADERAAIVGILEAAGANSREAEAQAHVLLEADLRGRPSHGLQRLITIRQRIENGVMIPGAALQVDRRADCYFSIDAQGGFGPYAAFQAVTLALDAAAKCGVAAAGLRNASHIGMLAPYLEFIVARRAIGIAFATSEALVHPAGGISAQVGTNPIGVGIPTDADAPFVVDMATGATTAGEIIARRHRGEQLLPGQAVDAEGYPTTEPEEALRGAISPFGGAKGYGLAVAVELLVALLTETALGRAVHGTLDVDRPVTKGDVFLVIDPTRLGLPNVAAYVSDYLRELVATPAAPGTDGVRMPGERARLERQRRLVEGIPHPRHLWQAIQQLSLTSSGPRAS
jgi:L-2-hydroxycarboxylate dehydrogenase (NAD+)